MGCDAAGQNELMENLLRPLMGYSRLVIHPTVFAFARIKMVQISLQKLNRLSEPSAGHSEVWRGQRNSAQHKHEVDSGGFSVSHFNHPVSESLQFGV